MGVQVGRNDDGWEISVFNVQLTDKGKELFCLEEMVRLPYLMSASGVLEC